MPQGETPSCAFERLPDELVQTILSPAFMSLRDVACARLVCCRWAAVAGDTLHKSHKRCMDDLMRRGGPCSNRWRAIAHFTEILAHDHVHALVRLLDTRMLCVDDIADVLGLKRLDLGLAFCMPVRVGDDGERGQMTTDVLEYDDPYQQDLVGFVPSLLYLAAVYGAIACMRLLIERGARPALHIDALVSTLIRHCAWYEMGLALFHGVQGTLPETAAATMTATVKTTTALGSNPYIRARTQTTWAFVPLPDWNIVRILETLLDAFPPDLSMPRVCGITSPLHSLVERAVTMDEDDTLPVADETRESHPTAASGSGGDGDSVIPARYHATPDKCQEIEHVVRLLVRHGADPGAPLAMDGAFLLAHFDMFELVRREQPHTQAARLAHIDKLAYRHPRDHIRYYIGQLREGGQTTRALDALERALYEPIGSRQESCPEREKKKGECSLP